MGAFHAYDIRGVYGVDFTRETVYKTGYFLPRLLGVDKVLVGRDCRVSSQEIHDALCDGIRDAAAAEELLSEIASGAGGVVQQDPVDTIASFDPLIDRSYDPALVILIVSAVLILLDIAVRKFKFKWLHEIIRDRKAMKELNTTPYTQQGESD